jgi:polyhydroxyalkanoate synthesis regulator phasin
MNSDNLVQLLQKGFRVTLGATATLIEVLQDPQRRDENLSKLQSEWSQLSEEWAEKGEVTEQEARSFVDDFLSRQSNSTTSSSSESASSAPSTTPTAPPDIQVDLQDLTAQIATIRAELEKLRNPDSAD